MSDDPVLRKIRENCRTREDFENLAKLERALRSIADLQERVANIEREDELRKRRDEAFTAKLNAAWFLPGGKPNGHLLEGSP